MQLPNIGDTYYDFTVESIDKVRCSDGDSRTRIKARCTCGNYRLIPPALWKGDWKRCHRIYKSGKPKQPKQPKQSRVLKGQKKGRTIASTKRALYCKYRKRAREHNRVFELSFERFCFLIEQNCNYCNRPPQQVFTKGKEFKSAPLTYNGIDRIDNSKGYLENNCVSCCHHCNTVKGPRPVSYVTTRLGELQL